MTPKAAPLFAQILSLAGIPPYRAVLWPHRATRNSHTERRITHSATKNNTPLKTLRR